MFPSLLGRVSDTAAHGATSTLKVSEKRRASSRGKRSSGKWNPLQWLSTTNVEDNLHEEKPVEISMPEVEGKIGDTVSEASESTAASETDTVDDSLMSQPVGRARCSTLVYERALMQAQCGRAMAQIARMQAVEVAETVEQGQKQIDHGRRVQEFGEAVRASPAYLRSLKSDSAATPSASDVARLAAESAAAATEAARRRAALARERAAASPLPGCVRL